MHEPLIFECGAAGRRCVRFPAPDGGRGAETGAARRPEDELPAAWIRERPANLPEVAEIDLVRHYTRLSQVNFSIDTNFYPLGSCTMKYNPKVNDALAALPGFARMHPLQPDEDAQGLLELLHTLERLLCGATGMDAFTLQPAAGAQGELTGMLCIHAYHNDRNDPRTEVVVPDSSHGTNPASARLCGYRVVTLPSSDRGEVDPDELGKVLGPQTAAVMLTNPNTLGLFESRILEVAAAAHEAGALLYYDGANMNALLGICRPGDMGFDVVHLNLHKTFSTPHGGGGPGAGPLGVTGALDPFLPSPRIVRDGDRFRWSHDFPKSIGRLCAFHGNVGVLIRAYAYARALGREGAGRVARGAITNANYLRARLREHYEVPYDRACMHEFVVSASRQRREGVSAMDIAKRLIDFEIHPPTVYFPLIVPEALMIEPTETESRETLDRFADAMERIAREAEAGDPRIRNAPHATVVRRLDEVRAARQPDLAWRPADATARENT